VEFNALTDEQLAHNLRTLLRPPEVENEQIDALQSVVQSLQVHRIELEMQNRALREAQAELEHAVRRYTDLYDHLPIGYVTLTASGRITEANLAAAEIARRERPRLIGGYLRNYLDAEDGARFAQHLKDCVDTPQQVTIEVVLRTEDGTGRDVQLSSRRAPMPAGAEPLVRTAITDISELKKTQRALVEINQEQEAFNYSISHDLRAPLVTISNFTHMVMTDHIDRIDDEGRIILHRIEAAAVRLDEMLKRLLEYSRLAREKILLEPVNLEEVVDTLLVEHRAMIEYRRAEIGVERPLGTVHGSRVLLGQALTNLLTNALKYTEPGERPKVQISAEPRAATIVLKIADQGIGIERKNHERVFQVFERVNDRKSYPGSGVGLAIVQRAVGRMNGRVWLESELHKGCCFHVELPKGF
jgi:PAS domain S-box-containing protein